MYQLLYTGEAKWRTAAHVRRLTNMHPWINKIILIRIIIIVNYIYRLHHSRGQPRIEGAYWTVNRISVCVWNRSDADRWSRLAFFRLKYFFASKICALRNRMTMRPVWMQCRFETKWLVRQLEIYRLWCFAAISINNNWWEKSQPSTTHSVLWRCEVICHYLHSVWTVSRRVHFIFHRSSSAVSRILCFHPENILFV